MSIPFFELPWDERDVQYVTDVIKRGMYWANGPEIKKFEDTVAAMVGTKYCLAFNSGTSALHSVLDALDIKGGEVIVPSFTFIATANSVLMAGGKPVFADIEDRTFGLDPEDVKEKIGSRTKTIMPVHYGGCSSRIAELGEIADDHGLLLIEDAAESLGASYGGRMVGSFGVAGMFSFTPAKVISTGEGGVIVTDSKDVYERMKLFRSHGRLETGDYFTSMEYMDYVTLGYNFRMPTICAALGLAQLEKLPDVIGWRREIGDYYTKELGSVRQLRTPFVPEECHHIYQMFSLLVEGGREERDALQKHLKGCGIISRVYFEPVHRTRFYQKELKYDPALPVTEEVAGRILSLPIYPKLTTDMMAEIVGAVKARFS